MSQLPAVITSELPVDYYCNHRLKLKATTLKYLEKLKQYTINGLESDFSA